MLAESILISIVVPAYNAEKTIIKCLDSILVQTYHLIEIIVVNDGSIDNTKGCIKDFIKKDARVKLIDKTNGGVSSARNHGVANCYGEYIVFVDSDDWIEPGHIEAFYKEIIKNRDVDLVCQDLYDSRVKRLRLHGYFTSINIIDAIFELERTDLIGYLHNKCFRMSILKNEKILFPEKISMSEDLIFNIEYLLCVKSITLIASCFYHYEDLPYSLSKKITSYTELKLRREITENLYSRLFKKIQNINAVPHSLKCLVNKRIMLLDMGMIFRMIINPQYGKKELMHQELLNLRKKHTLKTLLLFSGSEKIKYLLIRAPFFWFVLKIYSRKYY